MNRRRLFWLCAALLVISSVVTAIYCWSARDSDFVVIGRKTPSIRAHLAKLDETIDTKTFHDCKTVREALDRLGVQKTKRVEADPVVVVPAAVAIWLLFDMPGGVRLDSVAFPPEHRQRIMAAPVDFSAEPPTMTVKQFLRTIFHQADVPDVRFIVRGHGVDATNLERVQQEWQQYHERTTYIDRMRDFWKDLTGNFEDDSVRVWDVD